MILGAGTELLRALLVVREGLRRDLGQFVFRSPHKPARRIPVSQTGYRSHFADMSEVEIEFWQNDPPAPPPDEDAEAEEAESNPPAEEGLPETAESDGDTAESDQPAPAPSQGPESPQGLTQADWEARFQKVEKAWATYAKRVDVVWEEDALKLIPLTVSPSAPPGFLSADDAGRIPDEEVEVVPLPPLDELDVGLLVLVAPLPPALLLLLPQAANTTAAAPSTPSVFTAFLMP